MSSGYGTHLSGQSNRDCKGGMQGELNFHSRHFSSHKKLFCHPSLGAFVLGQNKSHHALEIESQITKKKQFLPNIKLSNKL